MSGLVSQVPFLGGAIGMVGFEKNQRALKVIYGANPTISQLFSLESANLVYHHNIRIKRGELISTLMFRLTSG